jgi:hypothetical protein
MPIWFVAIARAPFRYFVFRVPLASEEHGSRALTETFFAGTRPDNPRTLARAERFSGHSRAGREMSSYLEAAISRIDIIMGPQYDWFAIVPLEIRASAKIEDCLRCSQI